MTKNVLLSWSGGKDSALALYRVVHKSEYHIKALLTTLTAGYDRISMHGVRRELLEQQAHSLGLPLQILTIPQNCTDEEYDSLMRETLEKHLTQGVTDVVFGDVFLEDIRSYREERLAEVAMKGVFPLWGMDTCQLAQDFLNLGFKAVLVCVDTHKLDGGFAGRTYDENLLADLPPGIDPCGEHGAFHTFVYDGPIFHHRIDFQVGETVLREGRFQFCDLIPRG
ncbi:MAG: diphthine--ammonia ligase [Anaerolineales bacterium]